MKRYLKIFLVVSMILMLTLTGCNTLKEAKTNIPLNKEEVKKEDDVPMQEEAQTGALEELLVEFIDIGQGDAILLRTNEEVMLIDAGDNATEKDFVKQLEERGITKIDYLIGTHPHADHIGGLDKVIDAFEIGKIYMPKKAHTTKTYESVLTSIKNKGLITKMCA